jgi:hypothetical protein
VKAIFAYLDRVDQNDLVDEFNDEQRDDEYMKLIGTYFEQVWEPSQDKDQDKLIRKKVEGNNFHNFAKLISVNLKLLETEQSAIQNELDKMRRINERFIMQ